MSRAAAVGLLAALALGLSCTPAERKRDEVVFWQTWPVTIVQPLVNRFEAEYPRIHVRLERLAPQELPARIAAGLAAGQVPDLCQVGAATMPGLLAGGELSDWSAGVADLRPALRGWELCSVGDALYGLPWVLETRALFYDRDLFRRARLDPERPPETWDELYRDAARIQRLGHGVHGFGVPSGEPGELTRSVLPFLWANGGSILSGDLRHAVFDSSQNVEALEYVLSLRHVGALAPQDSLVREFERGRLGLLLCGASLFKRLPREAPDLHYGVTLVPAPAAGRGERTSWAGGEVLVSFGASKRKQDALELARFLARPENAIALAAAIRSVEPALAGADSAAHYRKRPLEAVMVRQLETARFTPSHPAWNDMQSALEEEIGQALEGHKSAAAAVRDAQARLAVLVGRQ